MSIDSLAGFKGMCGSLTGLTVIAVALRFVARKKNQLPLKADDWCMLAALIFFLGNMTTVYLLARVKFSGYNGDEGGNKVDIFVQKMTLSYQLILFWTLGAAKASVLFFYKRVFCQHRKMNRGFRIVIIATLIINLCWVVGFFLLGLLQCGTHFSFGQGHLKYCHIISQYQLGFFVSDIILDVWIMAMPIPYIIRLNISLPRKCLTIVVFLLSFVGIGASIARLVNYLQTQHLGPSGVDRGSMRSRSVWTTFDWFSTLEMGTAIVAINMPTLYGFFTKHVPEVILRGTRSWTSIASRVFSTSDTSSVRRRRGSEGSERRPSYNSDRHVVPTNEDVRTGEVYMHETVQIVPGKTREEA